MASPVRSASMPGVMYEIGGAIVKQAIAGLIRGGCRVETIAHAPLAVTFRTADGDAGTLSIEERAFVIVRGMLAATRFGSLDAAILAACRVPVRAVS
jgi:hypothetical protein